jgi:hypothetical protein
MPIYVHAVDQPDLPPLAMPERFRHEVTYFMTPPGEHGVPKLPEGEYWVRLEDSRRIYDEGALSLVSPLDSENKTEVELTEEQEAWLEWMIEHEVEHIRLEK